MKRSRIALLLSVLLTLSLAACGGGEPAGPELSEEPVVGDWSPAGAAISGGLYAFEDVPQLEDLYDTHHLSVREDGTFTYMMGAVFITKGTWTTSWREGFDHSYTLMSETGYRMTFTDGELVPGEETEKDTQYKLWLTNEDPDTMAFADPDSDVILYYTRDEGAPFYLDVFGSAVPGGGEASDEEAVREDGETEAPREETLSQPGTTPSDTGTVTMGMRNALDTARDYLDFMAFSYSGLIDQLEYEGYTYDEAVYAVDNCGADWYEQAALCAVNYLDTMSFSRSGLIDQLEYEGFTYDQAVYGVEQAGY